MNQNATSRIDISLSLFRSATETYLASFEWGEAELHTFGRRSGHGGVFLMKTGEGTVAGFLTFTIGSNARSLDINTGGTTGRYRNLGYGIPLLDSFFSLVLIMGIEDIETTVGQDNPFVLKLITETYGFGPQEKNPELSLLIGSPLQAQSNLYPVHFVGKEARRRIEHGAADAPPDPFGPRYDTIEDANQMPPDSTTVFVGVPYHIVNRANFYRRVFTFIPQLRDHPDPALPAKRIIWKSNQLAKAQSFLRSQDQNATTEAQNHPQN